MRIIIADDGVYFNGLSLEQKPLGGAESCVIWLAEAFARLGHHVTCLTNSNTSLLHNGVNWEPIGGNHPESADLYIANRGHTVLRLIPKARHVAFWIHNPAQYLLKTRYLWPLVRRKADMIFLSKFHASTLPAWVPGRRLVIPHGVDPVFYPSPHIVIPPGPRAVFLSNPLRGLDPLLDMWKQHVVPAIPSAELHLFTGPDIMSQREGGSEETQAVLGKAQHTVGVFLNPPLQRNSLASALRSMRVHCYPSTVPESFCLAIAESQACGVPAIVNDTGALPERITDKKTGFVTMTANPRSFADATIRLLSDDTLWQSMHQSLLLAPIRRWEDVARDFINQTIT